MRIEQLTLRQRDGVTCGPTVAIVGSALLDPDYGTGLADPRWFAEEQRRVHRRLNRVWPKALGTTPAGMARALSGHSRKRYRWRPAGPHDALADVREAVTRGYPVAMLVGRFIPRHWVLLFAAAGTTGFRCYEPSSGQFSNIEAEQIRGGELTGVGFPRPFAFVLPEHVT
jgi:hypothetical protein